MDTSKIYDTIVENSIIYFNKLCRSCLFREMNINVDWLKEWRCVRKTLPYIHFNVSIEFAKITLTKSINGQHPIRYSITYAACLLSSTCCSRQIVCICSFPYVKWRAKWPNPAPKSTMQLVDDSSASFLHLDDILTISWTFFGLTCLVKMLCIFNSVPVGFLISSWSNREIERRPIVDFNASSANGKTVSGDLWPPV